MKNLLILTAASLTMSLATPAFASDDDYKRNCGAATGQWMSIGAISDKASQKGYNVRGVEREGNCYEVKAVNSNGNRVELYMNPVTGEIVRVKNKY
ncbi:MAG: PepSY domain-containing protein [Rhizobiaceae bacterium]|nr:PepSY domain-containing protein [Rhizobiaceae bacterium]